MLLATEPQAAPSRSFHADRLGRQTVRGIGPHPAPRRTKCPWTIAPPGQAPFCRSSCVTRAAGVASRACLKLSATAVPEIPTLPRDSRPFDPSRKMPRLPSSCHAQRRSPCFPDISPQSLPRSTFGCGTAERHGHSLTGKTRSRHSRNGTARLNSLISRARRSETSERGVRAL